ncbi:ABC transporter substrate-binding protein [Aquipseudomonas alcaligenes]|uniref:ABC transporter substrate-binding protein n=1 Tax=Aquipseudomonas alcaligenes TaxID=43263 RepID=UPI003747F515
MLRQLVCCVAVSAVLLGGAQARAEAGVEAGELLLGMVNAQSGLASGLGQEMRAGAQAYFTRVNATGGVHGRRLTLVLRDDGYEPSRTARLTEELIDSRDIFALFGYVGTPTSRAAMPIAQAAGVPYLFPLSGAEVLRSPLHHWVFNVRASYFAEAELLAKHMTEELKLKRVALLMQDDSFGETVKGGLAAALHERGLQVDGEARIRRNSLEVEDAVRQLRAAEPEAIFFVGTYRQLARALREAHAQGMQARFFSVSFVGTEGLIAEAGAWADGVYISQVVPAPDDTSLALVRAYQKDMRGPLGYASLEGYIAATVLVEGLRKAGPQPTRSGLVTALQSLNLNVGGFPVRFGPDDHQGSDAVYLTRIERGRAVPVAVER